MGSHKISHSKLQPTVKKNIHPYKAIQSQCASVKPLTKFGTVLGLHE